MITAICLFCSTLFGVAQEVKPQEKQAETTIKTYTVKTAKGTVQHKVEVTTAMDRPVELADKDSQKVDQERVIPKEKTITKTVNIDNDADDAFDERIVFSYNADENQDFVLLSDKDKLTVAVDKGSDLQILEDSTMKEIPNRDKKTYIFTDENGKKVEFVVQEITML